MPLSNPFLKAVSAIDPVCKSSSLALTYMKKLPHLVRNVFSDREKELFELEVQNYHSDALLPRVSENERADEWWVSIKKSCNYPLLSRMACALLTCFHGPRVESSFSMMNNIITAGTTRLNVETFDSIQSIKYHLLAEEKSATDFFSRKDFLHDPVKKNLTKNLQSACRSYKNEKLEKRMIITKVVIDVEQAKQKALSKEKAKKLCSNAAKTQRLKHFKKHNKSKCSVSVVKNKGISKELLKSTVEKTGQSPVSVIVNSDISASTVSHFYTTKNSESVVVENQKQISEKSKTYTGPLGKVTNEVIKAKKRCIDSPKNKGPQKKQRTLLEMFERNSKK